MAQPEEREAQKRLSPEEALSVLEAQAKRGEALLANQPGLEPEVLAYLARNGAEATRRAVAANPATTPEANLILAADKDEEVRKNLALKIGRLFPGLLAEEEKQLRDMALATLEKLAQDQVSAVRAVLAEEIKSHDCVPKPIVKALASDDDPSVQMPVIEFSPQLEDEDLIQLVVASRASKILSAVARRKNLSGDVSEAVATTLDTDAVAALLANTDATIRTKTLDKIISNAAEVAEWHGPLVVRADLSPTAIERIAGFVGSKLIDTLAQRSGLDESVRGELKRRLDEKKKAEAKQDGAESHSETPLTGGALTEAFVFNAVEHCRKDTVVKALALLAKTGEDNVRRILSSQSGAAAVSLVWRAGLSMQVAYRLQVQVMRLSGISLVPARNGSEFPLKSDEMRRQLGNYGIA